MRPPSRRGVVAGLLAATASYRRPHSLSATGVDIDALESRLVSLLEVAGATAASNSPPLQDVEVERMISRLTSVGGSQREAAEGIGSWGSWIGAWDVLYSRPSFVGGPLGLTQSTAQLVSARQYVYGPVDAASDLRGVGGDGGISTECVYALAAGEAQPRAVVLSRLGSFTKLPAFDFRVDFSARARAYELNAGSAVAAGDHGRVRAAPSPTLTPLASQKALGVVDKPSGASLREIAYLSERLWISRSGDDGGVVVLQRSEAAPLVPPSERPDLTATCAEAVFVRGAICRKQALF